MCRQANRRSTGRELMGRRAVRGRAVGMGTVCPAGAERRTEDRRATRLGSPRPSRGGQRRWARAPPADVGAISRCSTHTNATPALGRIHPSNAAWRSEWAPTGQLGQPGLPAARDVVDDVDVADIAAAVGEFDAQALGRPRDVQMQQVTLLLDQHPVGVGNSERALGDCPLGAKTHGEDLGAGPRGAPDRPLPAVDRQLDELEGLFRAPVQLKLPDGLEVVHQAPASRRTQSSGVGRPPMQPMESSGHARTPPPPRQIIVPRSGGNVRRTRGPPRDRSP